MNQIQKTNQNHGDRWLQKANYRKSNKKWLGYSRKIALRILAAMEDVPGMNQKKLSGLAGVSPQHVSKIIKGQENLTLQTIATFSEILNFELISFPSFKYNQTFNATFDVNSNGGVIIVVYERHMIHERYEPMEVLFNMGSFELNRLQITLKQ